MLGIDSRAEPGLGVTAWAGRDRAAKVAAAAATLASGWDRLDAGELERLAEALEDHARTYLDWLCDLHGDEVHQVRRIVDTIRGTNTMLRQRTDAIVRRRLASMLGRAATALVDRINAVENG